MTTSISMVTPVFNGAETLSATLKSVLDQSPLPSEYIVVDATSTDGTLRILADHADGLRLISEPDLGIYDGMNKGVALASSEWVGIINADDQLAPGALKRVLEVAEENPKADIIHGGMVFVDEMTGLAAVVKKSGSTLHPLRVQVAFHPAMFVRRSVYDEIGGYDLNFPVAADWEWMVRAVRAGKVFVYVDEVLTVMHGGGTGSLRPLSNRRELLKMVRKHQGGLANYRWLVWEFLRDLKSVVYRRLELGEWSPKLRPDLLRAGGYVEIEEVNAMLAALRVQRTEG